MNVSASASFDRPFILYVEDEENDVLFMRRAIVRAGLGIELLTASDGDKAIACLASATAFGSPAAPDLVLLDLNLPAISGFEVLEWIRSQPALKILPVIVLSSSGRADDVTRARLLGADDYFIKPSSPSRLAEIATALWARWLSPEARAARRDATRIEPDVPPAQSALSSSQTRATIS